MTRLSPGRRPLIALKAIIWLGALAPLAILALGAARDDLGANPVERITHWTGRTALVLLLVTLAVTPVRRLSGWNRLVGVRRPLGLFAFFYATLHLLTYLVFDQFFSIAGIVDDIAKRPYITAGTIAFLLLVPLAATSTRASIRRLGKRWGRLHRLVYLAAGIAVLHFFWKASAKADVRDPLLFAAALGVLLAARIRPPARTQVPGAPLAASSSRAPASRRAKPPARPTGIRVTGIEQSEDG